VAGSDSKQYMSAEVTGECGQRFRALQLALGQLVSGLAGNQAVCSGAIWPCGIARVAVFSLPSKYGILARRGRGDPIDLSVNTTHIAGLPLGGDPHPKVTLSASGMWLQGITAARDIRIECD